MSAQQFLMSSAHTRLTSALAGGASLMHYLTLSHLSVSSKEMSTMLLVGSSY